MMMSSSGFVLMTQHPYSLWVTISAINFVCRYQLHPGSAHWHPSSVPSVSGAKIYPSAKPIHNQKIVLTWLTCAWYICTVTFWRSIQIGSALHSGALYLHKITVQLFNHLHTTHAEQAVYVLQQLGRQSDCAKVISNFELGLTRWGAARRPSVTAAGEAHIEIFCVTVMPLQVITLTPELEVLNWMVRSVEPSNLLHVAFTD